LKKELQINAERLQRAVRRLEGIARLLLCSQNVAESQLSQAQSAQIKRAHPENAAAMSGDRRE
jgi:hypothetical protein